MNGQTRIVLADDFPLLRESFSQMLNSEDSLCVAAEADNGEALLACIEGAQPSIVITDIEMPVLNGIEATKKIKELYPHIAVIALTMFSDHHLIVDMMEAGAKGYLLKKTSKEELLLAIDVVSKGGTYFCNNTTMKLSNMLAKSKMGEPQQVVHFSDKEKEIIQLICEEYASKQIATLTNLGFRTVEKYRNQIMEKTGARNMAGIVIYAIRHRLYVP